jgi:hypothetical protein
MHTKTTFYVALSLKLLKLHSTIVLFTVQQAVHFAPHKNISHAFNTTIPHASTSAIYYLQYFTILQLLTSFLQDFNL